MTVRRIPAFHPMRMRPITDVERVFIGLMAARLSDEELVHMESWRRYAAFGKFACRTEAEERAEEIRQQNAWIESGIFRLEMRRREELDKDQ